MKVPLLLNRSMAQSLSSCAIKNAVGRGNLRIGQPQGTVLIAPHHGEPSPQRMMGNRLSVMDNHQHRMRRRGVSPFKIRQRGVGLGLPIGQLDRDFVQANVENLARRKPALGVSLPFLEER